MHDATLRGWVNLRLNFRLNRYISRQYLWTVRWGTGYATTLLPEVFTQRNSLFDWSWILFLKNKKSLFQPPFGGLMSNVCTPSKAHGRLPIRHNWTFLAISYYRWDGNLLKSAFVEGGGSLWAQISDGKVRRPPTTVGVRKLEWLSFRVVLKHPQCCALFGFVTKHACVGQTDRQNKDSQDHTSSSLSKSEYW